MAAFVTFVIHGKIIYTLGLAAAICGILEIISVPVWYWEMDGRSCAR
ncbi:MAG: hypothetical protein ACLR8P_11715 [Clostridium fessum]